MATSQQPSTIPTSGPGRTRLEIELEFVQCLANPFYLCHLAQTKVLEDPRFINYITYLNYWREPEYARMLSYPIYTLNALTLLSEPRFRIEIANAGLAYEMLSQMVQTFLPVPVSVSGGDVKPENAGIGGKEEEGKEVKKEALATGEKKNIALGVGEKGIAGTGEKEKEKEKMEEDEVGAKLRESADILKSKPKAKAKAWQGMARQGKAQITQKQNNGKAKAKQKRRTHRGSYILYITKPSIMRARIKKEKRRKRKKNGRRETKKKVLKRIYRERRRRRRTYIDTTTITTTTTVTTITTTNELDKIK
ncbi:SOH1-domain-containing protein [Pyronema omphalodes]|nr:SOH1-domain-containing protein [Pyronema omphalodes]